MYYTRNGDGNVEVREGTKIFPPDVVEITEEEYLAEIAAKEAANVGQA